MKTYYNSLCPKFVGFFFHKTKQSKTYFPLWIKLSISILYWKQNIKFHQFSFTGGDCRRQPVQGTQAAGRCGRSRGARGHGRANGCQAPQQTAILNHHSNCVLYSRCCNTIWDQWIYEFLNLTFKDFIKKNGLCLFAKLKHAHWRINSNKNNSNFFAKNIIKQMFSIFCCIAQNTHYVRC